MVLGLTSDYYNGKEVKKYLEKYINFNFERRKNSSASRGTVRPGLLAMTFPRFDTAMGETVFEIVRGAQKGAAENGCPHTVTTSSFSTIGATGFRKAGRIRPDCLPTAMPP